MLGNRWQSSGAQSSEQGWSTSSMPKLCKVFVSFPRCLILTAFCNFLASWHSTIHWWCGPFVNSQEVQCILHPQKAHLSCKWNNPDLLWGRCGGIVSTTRVLSLSLAQNDETNTHPDLGNFQRNQMDLPQTMSESLVVGSAWYTSNQVLDVTLTK